MSAENDILIEYEPESVEGHYVCWQPLLTVISSGTTKMEALYSLQEAAHYLIDSLVRAKIRDIREDNAS